MNLPPVPPGLPPSMNAWCNALLDVVASLQAQMQTIPQQMQRPMPQGRAPMVGLPNASENASTISGNTTLDISQMCRWAKWNCTSPCALTLPVAEEGMWYGAINYGASVLTVKNPGGVSLGALNQYCVLYLFVVSNSTGVPAWGSGVWPIIGPSGTVYMSTDTTYAAGGPFIQDTHDGNWYRLTVYDGHLVTVGASASLTEVEP